jgi:hypothetical protein
MPLYWLCYRHNNQISVVIEPGASLVHARMRASLANLDQGEFTEGHELDGQVASTEGDDWTQVVLGRSEKIVGKVALVLHFPTHRFI